MMLRCRIWFTAFASAMKRETMVGLLECVRCSVFQRSPLPDDRVHRGVHRAEGPFSNLPLDLVLADDVTRREVLVEVRDGRVRDQRLTVVEQVSAPSGSPLAADRQEGIGDAPDHTAARDRPDSSISRPSPIERCHETGKEVDTGPRSAIVPGVRPLGCRRGDRLPILPLVGQRVGLSMAFIRVILAANRAARASCPAHSSV